VSARFIRRPADYSSARDDAGLLVRGSGRATAIGACDHEDGQKGGCQNRRGRGLGCIPHSANIARRKKTAARQEKIRAIGAAGIKIGATQSNYILFISDQLENIDP
jgi:hypothetical protein